MAKRDYYDVLGVSRGANAGDMKSAFRRQAKELHPDRNPGDKAAEAKFKELSEAYDVLRDDQKRAAYDQFGHAAFEKGRWSKSAGSPPPETNDSPDTSNDSGFASSGRGNSSFHDFFGDGFGFGTQRGFRGTTSGMSGAFHATADAAFGKRGRPTLEDAIRNFNLGRGRESEEQLLGFLSGSPQSAADILNQVSAAHLCAAGLLRQRLSGARPDLYCAKMMPGYVELFNRGDDGSEQRLVEIVEMKPALADKVRQAVAGHRLQNSVRLADVINDKMRKQPKPDAAKGANPHL